MAIKVDDVEFLSLFTDSFLYFIPTYQRSYAWEKEPHIQDFWEDLVSAFESGQPQYIMGTIYLAEIKNQNDLMDQVAPQVLNSVFGITENNIPKINCNNQKAKARLIVDGQQRILTFFILNKVFDDVGIKYSIYDNFFCALMNDSKIPRLILGENDFIFFNDLVFGKHPKPSTQSNRKIYNAYEYLYQQVEKYKNSNHASFQGLYDYLKDSLFVLKANIDNLNIATTIFITQSDRGKELTYLEKLKGTISFYSNKIANITLSKDIDRVFGEIFKVIDQFADNGIKKPIDAENEIVSLVRHLIDVRDESARDSFNNIKNDLRTLDTSGLSTRISLIVEAVDNISKLYSHIIKNLSLNEIEKYTSQGWYPYKMIFNILKPNLKSLSLLAEFHKWGFPLHDCVYQWNRNTCCDKAISQIPILDNKYSELLNKIETIKDNDDIKVFLLNKLKNIQALITKKLDKDPEISLFNFIEGLELGIWKVGKYPWNNFSSNYNVYIKNTRSPDAQSMINAFNWLIEGWRTDYMMRDWNYDIYTYIFLEYERCIYNNDISLDFMGKKIWKEHIFPQTQDPTKINLHKYGFNDPIDYNRWIWRIGNIMLLEVKEDIKATNNPIVAKIPIYKGSKLKSVADITNDLEEISSNKKIKNNPNPYFKLYLEIRELEIMHFTYCRFI